MLSSKSDCKLFYLLDPQIRWMASKRELGLPKDFLYQHHDDRYQGMVISGYDQEYNKKIQPRSLRKWDQHKLKWAPERTDYPLQGEGTKFGLSEIKAKRDDRDNEETQKVTKSTFADSYVPHSLSGREAKAVPRDLSSKMEPISRLNKNLKLRNAPIYLVPDSYVNIELLESKLKAAEKNISCLRQQ